MCISNNLIIEKEGEENLSNSNSLNKSNISFFNQFKSAFSLVELSIVLIIIGLLISAVIGGRALIDQAKINVIKSELETIRIALANYINDGQPLNTESVEYDGPAIGPEELINAGYLEDPGLIVHNGYNDHVYKSKVSNNAWYKVYMWGLAGSNSKNRECFTASTTKNKNGKLPVFNTYYYVISNTAWDYSLNPVFCDKLADKLMSYYGESVTSSNLTWSSPSKINKIYACCAKHKGGLNKAMLYLAIYDPYI